MLQIKLKHLKHLSRGTEACLCAWKIAIIILFVLIVACAHNTLQMEAHMTGSVNPLMMVLPKPKSLITKDGIFVFNGNCAIAAKGCALRVAEQLKLDLHKYPQFNLSISEGGNIILVCDAVQKYDESYNITIEPSKITISAASEKGLFWATRTLLQIIMHAKQLSEKSSLALPCAEICDEPAFHWRGLNLDCARHFISKEYLLRTIDVLALYRMNVLHLHLTDDQGWRLEIKKYPRLTEIGAWRKQKNKMYGGFYTQREMKEIIEYAAKHHVMVVPEIDMPGHVQAALASYPHLSCTGENIEVSTRWGIHKDVLCLGKESTFEFVTNVLDEVCELFPSKYIHIGGDECLTLRWKRCAYCQKRIQKEKLPNEKALLGYFIKRVAEYLSSKGKILIGWDEIAEWDLPKQVMMQAWRSFTKAENAAANGYDTIVSPTSHCYFDYGITYTGLERVYSFFPIPPMLPLGDEHRIVGSEACMWTEFAPEHKIDRMLYPRLIVFSETIWSPLPRDNFGKFVIRLRAQYPLLKEMGIQFGPESECYFSRLRYNGRMLKVLLSILVNDFEAAMENLKHYQPTQ